MSDTRFKRTEEIYFTVARLPAEQRVRVLAELCADDAGLRAGVESLLDHTGLPEDFLATPAVARAAVASITRDAGERADPMIGRVVGKYRILERIASGGMGTVYVGDRADGVFRQQVAIKVVKRGMDTDEIVRRFRLERQTLANLDHPNMARLLDGGATDDGRPYIVMEFVHGLPIDRYCEQGGLDVTARLRLFLQVCRAVQSAHQNLVVHRDLKPGNILVTSDGTPKLLDFGIAKVLQGPEGPEVTARAATVVDERRLTPEYASPEQIRGLTVTTASDVYSLGVVLYELLSGRQPYQFRTRSPAEIERVVCQIDPPPPSAAAGPNLSTGPTTPTQSMRRQLRGDLDTIVLMAMRKEPARRYASVEQFAGDIERYLGGLPVLAQHDTFGYRAGKFVRRNAVATAAALGIGLAALLGGGGIVWQSRETARERDAAFLARDQSEKIAKFLRDALASASPTVKGPDVTVREVLEDTAARVDNELGDHPLVHAAVLSSIGTSYLGLGMLPEAESCIQRALDERRALLGERTHDVAESKLDMASLKYAKQEFAEAEVLLRQVLDVFQTIRGSHNPDISRTMNDLGAVLRSQGKLEEAEGLLRQALEMRRAHDGADSLPVAETLNNLARAMMEQRERAEAEEMLVEALRIRRLRLPQRHMLVAQSVGNLAVFYAAGRDFARAEPLLREAHALEQSSSVPDHPEHASTMSNLAGVLLGRGGAAEEARALLERSLAIRRAALPAGDARTAYTRALLGRSLLDLQRYEEAEVELTGAAQELHAAGPLSVSRRAAALEDLARVYDATGRAGKGTETRAAIKEP